MNSNNYPVLIFTQRDIWLYLYCDAPYATYTAWQEFLDFNSLEKYYEINSDKKPKYIYISEDYFDVKWEVSLRKMFVLEKSYLESGLLYTVID